MKVSIIVPVYNTEKYVGKCIESLIHQTYNDIEVVLIDDGSKDNSLEILNNYASEDSRIKVYSQKNSGAYATRNRGVQLSTGEYIMFVDSDDWVEKNTIEFLVKKLNEYKVDIIKFGMIIEKNRKEIYLRQVDEKDELLIEDNEKSFVYNKFLSSR